MKAKGEVNKWEGREGGTEKTKKGRCGREKEEERAMKEQWMDRKKRKRGGSARAKREIGRKPDIMSNY